MVLLVLLLGVEDRPLTVHTDMVLVARAMARPDSGLEIRDRLWLKITIPRAFIGQSALSWWSGGTQCGGQWTGASQWAWLSDGTEFLQLLEICWNLKSFLDMMEIL